MNAIALLTLRPTRELLDRYQTFAELGFDVFVVVDDTDFAFDAGALRVVRVDEAECIAQGFYGFNQAINKPSRCSAWDKALCFLSREERGFGHVWIIEDDVHVAGPATLANLDAKHPNADIVSKENITNDDGEVSSWYYWQHVPADVFPLPWARSLVCAVRLSKRLLTDVRHLVEQQRHRLDRTSAMRRLLYPVAGRLPLIRRKARQLQPEKSPFIEFVFHTIALHNGYDVAVAEELQELHYRKDWAPGDFRADALYHPVKWQTFHR